MKQTSTITKVMYIICLIILIVFTFCSLFPLLWLFMSGLKTNDEIFLHSWGLPTMWKFGNFLTSWQMGVQQYFINSVFVTAISLILGLVLAIITAYPLARMNFKGKNLIMLICIAGFILSPQVVMIPVYKLFKLFGIYNTYAALIVPYITFYTPMSIVLLSSYFKSIPIEIEDAAIIDGCGTIGILRNVIIPLGKPMIASCAVLMSLSMWNEYFFALVMIDDDNLKTITVGVQNLRTQLSTDYGLLMAGLAISCVPMIIFFLIFQKQFIRGLTAGSVKG